MSILDDARPGMDPAIRPQDDLFGHVNGRWLVEEEIPSDRSSWGPFVQLADEAEEQVHRIIEDLARVATDSDDSTDLNADAQKIGDLYASFMDEERIERLGIRPVRPLISAVDNLRDVRDLAAFLGEFERIGGHGLFEPHGAKRLEGVCHGNGFINRPGTIGINGDSDVGTSRLARGLDGRHIDLV